MRQVSVTVSLRDNGRGFDPGHIGSSNMAGHFGLLQMRERIMDLGGTLHIHSEAGRVRNCSSVFRQLPDD